MIKKLFFNMTLRTKLLISYITVIIFSITAFGISMFSSFSNKLNDEIYTHTSQITDLAVDNFSSTMKNIESILNNVQADPAINKILTSSVPEPYYEEIAKIENELSSIDPLRTSVSDLHLYLENRDSSPAAYDSIVTSSKYYTNEIWYQNTISLNGGIYWTVMDSSDLNSTICAARAFIDTRTHELLGVIRADVNLSYFTSGLAHISVDNPGKLFLVYNNHIINTWNDPYINSFINEPIFFDSISSQYSSPQMITIKGVDHIICHQELMNSNLKLVFASSYSDINKDTKVIASSISIAGLVALILAIISIFLLTRWLTAPIAKIILHMKKFEENHERVPIEISSKDEIGKLCDSYNSMLRTIDSLIADVESLYKRQKIFELKALQAQINPHFLYNTLDSIHWMARSHHATDISKMVSALGTFFRHSLNKVNEYTTIENELKQIISYTDIQKIRFEDKFNMQYDIDDSLLSCKIIKLTIQPLVENSILHGFEDIDEGGIINIRIYQEGEYIFIEVADNGCGTDTDALNEAIQSDIDYNEPIEKFGLTNVNLRIKLYFDDTCGLTFKTNKEGGVTAIIKIRRYNNELKNIDL